MKKILKNITPKMITIWAISFVCLIVIGFGTTAGILASIKKTYGIEIKTENVFHITYQNENGTKQISDTDSDIQGNVINNIVGKLNSGRKTNKLMDIFRGNPSNYSVESNTTDIRYNSSFDTTYQGKALIIWFTAPQYHVTGSLRNGFDLGKNEGTTNNIYTILIPLDKTANRIQEQTWYLMTVPNPEVLSPNYITIPNIMKTHANYSSLWSYINDLDLF